ncbi:MAG: hypothetical protein JXB60_03340 [Candidatus Cloacimonetes bacterium]|nr:hypothetical protein [Candidatus Cloacimonadota bacterium]
MDKKTFFANVMKETNIVLTSVIDKVGEFGRISGLKLQINGLKGKIRYCKRQIGEIACNNKDRFGDFPEIQTYFEKISKLEEEIEIKQEQITEIREKAIELKQQGRKG